MMTATAMMLQCNLVEQESKIQRHAMPERLQRPDVLHAVVCSRHDQQWRTCEVWLSAESWLRDLSDDV